MCIAKCIIEWNGSASSGNSVLCIRWRAIARNDIRTPFAHIVIPENMTKCHNMESHHSVNDCVVVGFSMYIITWWNWGCTQCHFAAATPPVRGVFLEFHFGDDVTRVDRSYMQIQVVSLLYIIICRKVCPCTYCCQSHSWKGYLFQKNLLVKLSLSS